MDLRKMATFALALAFLGSIATFAAQKQKAAASKPAGSAKLEELLNAAEIPFNRAEEGHYAAVFSTGQNESEKFHIYLEHLGDDPNQERLQFYRMYFLLGQMPNGVAVPSALIKQINAWNTNLSMGKVIAVEGSIMYVCTAWLFQADASSLVQDAAVGHYASDDLRKSVAPYLKQ
ncbi:MAG TPA: hypothetical protein VNW97_07100 [Candidatus Saccharimonadales bacterium]|jgi:hypothetical protein|nr:hypothetical protein [Candidatus Saccharimonadales bacterium]